MFQDMLAPFADDPASAGLFLDFDGTLSHIAPTPSDARPLPGVAETLRDLSARYGVVAVVSGRSAHELLAWLGPGIEIWGTHGAQRCTDGRVHLSPDAARYGDLMAQVKQEALSRVDDPALEGVLVEDKEVVIVLHFRAARRRDEARVILEELAEDLARRHGLVRAAGRLALELRPPIELSKAKVVADRARDAGLKAVMFVGDDEVDIPAFDALDDLGSRAVVTLRVAVRSDEAPTELLDRADVIVDGPAGVVELLATLARTGSSVRRSTAPTRDPRAEA